MIKKMQSPIPYAIKKSLLLLLIVVGTPLFAQVSPFLDPSFLDAEPAEAGDESQPVTTPSKIPPSLNFNFDLILLPRYVLINSENPYDPPNQLYFPSFDNLLQAHNRLNYLFWERRISWNWDSSLYVLTEEKDGSAIAFTTETEFILNQVNLIFNFGGIATLGLGKIVIAEGAAFLTNPTDFIDNRPDLRNSSVFYRNRSIGTYQIQFGLSLGDWGWDLAYIPQFKNADREFSRDYPRDPLFGELWSRLSWQTDAVTTKLIFYWNGYAQGGINISAGIGDEVVLFFDAAAKTLALPAIKQTEGDPGLESMGYRNYEVAEDYNYHGQGLLGLTYTPANLFTLTVETYINFSEDRDYWNNYVERLKSLERTAVELENHPEPNLRPLAARYWGIMNNALNDHDPLSFQMVFLAVDISRNDAFADFTTQVFNFSTRLVYSPLDTGFLWLNHIAWEAASVMKLGLFTTWYFGKENGVFTSLPRNFSFGLATQLSF